MPVLCYNTWFIMTKWTLYCNLQINLYQFRSFGDLKEGVRMVKQLFATFHFDLTRKPKVDNAWCSLWALITMIFFMPLQFFSTQDIPLEMVTAWWARVNTSNHSHDPGPVLPWVKKAIFIKRVFLVAIKCEALLNDPGC